MSAKLYLRFPNSNKPDKKIEVAPTTTGSIIGRGVDVHISLSKLYPKEIVKVVSAPHCKICFEDGHFVIVDLDSTNGTWVNNQKITARMPKRLRNSDNINFANKKRLLVIVQIAFDEETTHQIHLNEQTNTQNNIETPTELKNTFVKGEFHGKKEVITINANPISRNFLAKKEEKLLVSLYNNAPNVCSLDEIANCVWGDKPNDPPRNQDIQALVSKLRKKLAEISPLPNSPKKKKKADQRFIETVHGRGYRFKKN